MFNKSLFGKESPVSCVYKEDHLYFTMSLLPFRKLSKKFFLIYTFMKYWVLKVMI